MAILPVTAWCYNNIWQRMAVYGSVWQTMAMYGNVWQCVADTWHVWQHWPPQAETDSDNGWVLVGVLTTLTIDILHQSFLIKQIVKRQNLMQ